VNDRLRIGDAERETAAHELGEHFAMGRITADEHAERLEQIYAARTQADLAPAFVDLPRPRGSAPARDRRSWTERPSFPHVPFLLKVLIAIVAVVLVVSHLPLLILALLVYVFAIRRATHRHPRHPHWR
jgi:hypothetical protein